MPGNGAPAAICAVTEQSPTTNVLVVTVFQDDDPVFAAVRAGERSYVPKEVDADDFGPRHRGRRTRRGTVSHAVSPPA
jgi:DNA-binding NarL/FixJ family response regulator